MPKILATDLDGTLFFPKKITRCIPKKNVKFLRKWIDAGNKLVLVSSRGITVLKQLEEEIQRPYDMIICTSSCIIHDGKVIKDEFIPNDAMKIIVKGLNEKYHPKALLLTTKDYPLIIRNNDVGAKLLLFFYKLFWYWGFKTKEPYIIDNNLFDKEIEEGKIYKLMTFFGLRKKNKEISKIINKEIRKDYPQIECSWSIMVNEITPCNCNKGQGLKEYCEKLNLDPKDVIVVGDSGNDITMFDAFHENSYVMRKAYPSVKKHAKHSISRFYKLEKFILKEKQND